MIALVTRCFGHPMSGHPERRTIQKVDVSADGAVMVDFIQRLQLFVLQPALQLLDVTAGTFV